jgi:hypothetical protein
MSHLNQLLSPLRKVVIGEKLSNCKKYIPNTMTEKNDE